MIRTVYPYQWNLNFLMIVIFTSHKLAAKTACDLSIHSSQSHSLTVCRALSKWFAKFPGNTIDFVDAPL